MTSAQYNIYIFHNISGESCVLIYADKFQSSKVKLRYVAPEKLTMWSDFIFILTSETRWSAERDESLHQWLFLFSFCKTKDRKWTLRKCKRWTNELKIITDVWSKNTAGWLSLVRVDLYSTSCSSRFCCQCVLTFPAVRTRCWRSADASVWNESGQQTSRHDWSAAAASRWPDAGLWGLSEVFSHQIRFSNDYFSVDRLITVAVISSRVSQSVSSVCSANLSFKGHGSPHLAGHRWVKLPQTQLSLSQPAAHWLFTYSLCPVNRYS